MVRALLFAAILSACAEPVGYTLGEAAEDVAFGLCSRWIRCGTTDIAWTTCVSELVWEFCDLADCSVEYPEYKRDNVVTCSEWYAELQCGLWVEPCSL